MATFRKRGSTWQVMVRKVGSPPQSATFDTKAEAERWATKIEAQIHDGAHIETVKDLTVRDLFERYRDEVSVNKKGKRWETIRINRLINTAHFTRKKLSKVNPSDIQAWRDQRLKEISGESVNREMNQISAIFTHARKEWRMGVTNPVREVKRPPKNPHRTRRPSEREVKLLLDYFRFDIEKQPTSTFEYVGWLIQCALNVAMRRGEWVTVLWSDVHLNEQWLHLRDSKNGMERDVPLSKSTCNLLARLPRTGERVFPVNPDTVTAYFGKACVTLGIRDLRIHDLRRAAITELAKVASDALELSAFTGHKDLKSLKIYYNPSIKYLVGKLD